MRKGIFRFLLIPNSIWYPSSDPYETLQYCLKTYEKHPLYDPSLPTSLS